MERAFFCRRCAWPGGPVNFDSVGMFGGHVARRFLGDVGMWMWMWMAGRRLGATATLM